MNVLSPAEGTEKRVFVEQKKRDDLLINQCHRIIINKLDLTRSKKKKSKKKKEKKLKSLTLSNDSFNYGERERIIIFRVARRKNFLSIDREMRGRRQYIYII